MEKEFSASDAMRSEAIESYVQQRTTLKSRIVAVCVVSFALRAFVHNLAHRVFRMQKDLKIGKSDNLI